MKLVFDLEYDMAYVHFTAGKDLHHTERPFSIDENGNVVGLSMYHLSQGADLTHPRIPRDHIPELARRLKRKGCPVTVPEGEPAAAG